MWNEHPSAYANIPCAVHNAVNVYVKRNEKCGFHLSHICIKCTCVTDAENLVCFFRSGMLGTRRLARNDIAMQHS